MDDTHLKDFDRTFEDVKQLYKLSESEVILLSQLLMTVKMLGWPMPLTIRLMEALTALIKMTTDMKEVDEKRF